MAVEKVKISAFLVQGLATLSIANIATITGFVWAWPSYTLGNFISKETVLSYPMSPMEISLLGSLPNIGALIATPFCGYSVNTYGRKYSAMLFGLPFLLSWTIISLTTYVPLVIAAIGMAGFGAAGQAVATVYISEIAQDSIRGGLSSTIVAGYFFGLMISYILGGYLSFLQVVYAHLLLSVIYVGMIMLLKESPVFLIQKGKYKEAAESIAFYRRTDTKSKEVENEISKIKLQLDPRIDKILQGENGDFFVFTDYFNYPDLTNEFIPEPEKEPPVSSWKFLMNSKSSKRALGASLFLMVSNTLMGAIVLQVYAEPLFKAAVPSMSSNLCAIFLALDFMVSCMLCAAIVDRYGRKFLMTSTSIASGVCLCILGAQLQLSFAPPWFTAFLIYAFCFINYLGAATVPFIIAAEVFLPEVRGLGSSITMASLWISNFGTLMIFNPLVDEFGLGPLFYGFAGVCFLTALYSQFCLPETKGLSADAIQLLFLKK